MIEIGVLNTTVPHLYQNMKYMWNKILLLSTTLPLDFYPCTLPDIRLEGGAALLPRIAHDSLTKYFCVLIFNYRHLYF